MHDDDRLTAGKLAAIVAAGPPDVQSSAGVTAGCILASMFLINSVALAVNLLPFRPLDGGQLLTAARLRLSRA